jgi:hypothetical protein
MRLWLVVKLEYITMPIKTTNPEKTKNQFLFIEDVSNRLINSKKFVKM